MAQQTKAPTEELEKDTLFLRGYGLPDDEVVSESYTCALFLSPISKPAGKLYLTKNYICFVGQKIVGGESVKSWFVKEVLDISPVHRTSIKISGLTTKSCTLGNFAGGEETRDRILRTMKRLLYGINGGNALHKAVMEGEWEPIKHICERDVTKLSEFNSNYQTPLVLACIAKNDVAIVEYLLDIYKENTDKLDINQIDERDVHVLHEACKSPEISDEILKKLLEFPGIKVNSKQKIDNNTPLHYFCEKNHSLSCEIIGKLLIEKGADVNSQNAQHETPLHRAILNTSVRKFMVKMLLNNKASVDIRAGNSGDTPLHYAVRVGSLDLVKILVEHGADITLKNNDGEDPQSLAISQNVTGTEPVVEFLKQVTFLLQMLKKADLSDLLAKFVGQGLGDPHLLCQLNEDQLQTLGVEKMGPRMRLIREIQEFKEEMDTREQIEKNQRETEQNRPLPGDESVGKNLKKDLGDIDSRFEIDEKDLEYLDELGKGASGKVFSGRYKKKKVAIKVIHQQNSGEEIQDFKKELQVLTSVSGEHIIEFIGVTYEPRLCVVMEFAENGSLHNFLKKPPIPFNWGRLLSFTLDTAKGIESLHTHNPPVVHRDLKSLNLLVTSDWRIKVCDFGLSRQETPDQLVTLHKICGTCAYCSPEILNGKKCTPKSDVYSFGIVVWEMVHVVMTGTYEIPFAELDLSHQIQILVEASKGYRPTLPAGAPIDIVQLYQDCVLGTPEDRPSSTEVVKKVQKMQAAHKENPSEWANTKSRSIHSSSRGDSDNSRSSRDEVGSTRNRDSSRSSRDDLHNSQHNDRISGSPSDSNRNSRDDVSKSRDDAQGRSREFEITNGKRHKRTASQTGTAPPGSSERTRAKLTRAATTVESSSDEERVSFDGSDGGSDGGSGGGSGDTDSDEKTAAAAKKKAPSDKISTKKKDKKPKKRDIDDDTIISGSGSHNSSGSDLTKSSRNTTTKRDREKISDDSGAVSSTSQKRKSARNPKKGESDDRPRRDKGSGKVKS